MSSPGHRMRLGPIWHSTGGEWAHVDWHGYITFYAW